MTSAWWWWPFLACLVLAGIHGYLGIHVLKRKVIFVDLAMAQIAALGAAYAVFLGYDGKEEGDALPIYLFSLGFTAAGAAVIALTRMRHERVPHEALIGIVYASASALAILILSKSAGEGEQIKHMLVGHLLTVTPSKVGVTVAIYAAIGLFHWVFRDRFLRISEDPEAAEKAGISVRLWDFLFYLSFGVIITSSVSIAGVLLVFSYLVVPGVIAVMFADRTGVRIGVAWTAGFAVSVAGMVLSYLGDFDAGPAVVATFAAALVLAGLVHYVVSSERSGAAARRLVLTGAGVALLVWGTTFLRKAPAEHAHREDDHARLVEALKSDDPTRQLDAIHHLEHSNDPHAAEPIMELLRRSSNDRIVEHAAHALATLGSVQALPLLKEVAAKDLDPLLRVEIARSILDLRDPGGFAMLLSILEAGPPAVVRDEAAQLFEERAGVKGDLAALKKWWAERGAQLRWRRETKRFE
jgi:zinc/manganese transport system permease protein